MVSIYLWYIIIGHELRHGDLVYQLRYITWTSNPDSSSLQETKQIVARAPWHVDIATKPVDLLDFTI